MHAQVIHGLVSHFMRFVSETRELPVLWHRSLLAFVQRYKSSISPADKERSVVVCMMHPQMAALHMIGRPLYSLVALHEVTWT